MIQKFIRARLITLLFVGVIAVTVACSSAPAPVAPSAPAPAAPAPAAPTTGAPAAPQPPAAPSAPAPAAPAATAMPAAPGAPVPAPTLIARPVRTPPPPQTQITTAEIVMDLVEHSGLPRAQGSGVDIHLTETLFIPAGGPGSNIVGGWLAESWELTPTFDSATIKLREGVQFHKGYGEMTAKDVAWSFNDVFNPESLHTATGRFRPIFNEMELVDSHTVNLPFKAPQPLWNSSFLNQFSFPFPVVSTAALEQNGPDWMIVNIIGTGAYEMTRYNENALIGLQAVPDHYFKSGQIEFINIREVPEASTRRAMLETGQADAGIVPLKDIRDMLEGGFNMSDAGKSSLMGMWYTGNYWEENDFNCQQGRSSPNCPDITPGQPMQVALERPGYDPSKPWIGEFGNDNSMEQARKVRMAMSMAIDREAINDVLLDGLGRQLHSGSFPAGDPNWNSKWQVPFAPQESERLLDEAGFPRGSNGIRFETQLHIGPHIGGAAGTGGEMGDAIGGMWDAIGIQTEILKTAYSAYRPSAVNREINTPWLNACGGGDARESTPWDWPRGLVMTSMSRGGFGCGMELPQAAEIYNQAVSEPDINRRIELNNQLLDFYHHWMVNSGIVVVPDPVVWNTRSFSGWNMRASSGAVLTSLDNIVPALR